MFSHYSYFACDMIMPIMELYLLLAIITALIIMLAVYSKNKSDVDGFSVINGDRRLRGYRPALDRDAPQNLVTTL